MLARFSELKLVSENSLFHFSHKLTCSSVICDCAVHYSAHCNAQTRRGDFPSNNLLGLGGETSLVIPCLDGRRNFRRRMPEDEIQTSMQIDNDHGTHLQAGRHRHASILCMHTVPTHGHVVAGIIHMRKAYTNGGGIANGRPGRECALPIPAHVSYCAHIQRQSEQESIPWENCFNSCLVL